MKYRVAKTFIIVSVALLLIVISAGCEGNKNKNLFERAWGLETLSINGETTLWDITVSKGDVSVTILETFYNDSHLYIGFRLEGEDLINSDTAFVFSYDGEQLGKSAHGPMHDDFSQTPWRRYHILSPSSLSTQINELPDEFTLHFRVFEQSGMQREFEFDIPLKRSEKEIKDDRNL